MTARAIRLLALVLLVPAVGWAADAPKEDPFADANAPSALLPIKEHGLTWYPTLDQALAAARKEGRRVFVDFTGVNCANCKVNERTVFSQPEALALLKEFSLAKLYADEVPDAFYPKEVVEKEGEE